MSPATAPASSPGPADNPPSGAGVDLYERLGDLATRLARAEAALVRLGLRRCHTCGLWLNAGAIGAHPECPSLHADLIAQEARW